MKRKADTQGVVHASNPQNSKAINAHNHGNRKNKENKSITEESQ